MPLTIDRKSTNMILKEVLRMYHWTLQKACVVSVLIALIVIPLNGSTAVRAAELVPVGVAKVDITPETPVRMYGYASRTTESEGIASRLKASALVIGGDQGEGPAILLAVDCGAVPADLREEVLRRVQAKVPLKPERFMLSNSHNHSGPNLKGMDSIEGEQLEHLEQYAELLTNRLEGVVLEALASRKPGSLAWATGTVGFAANRRVLKDGKWSGFGAVPDAPVDHTLPVMRVTDADGSLRAVVINYACHCTTLRGDFKQLHGDWAACAQEYIEANHPGAVALVTIGCGADSDPCPHSTVELCEQHGKALSDEVRRVLEGEFQPIEPNLKAQSVVLQIPYQTPPSIEELEARSNRSWQLESLLELLRKGEKPPTTRTFQIATWVFGDDLAMVFLSDEVVVDYALRLKRELDADRLWITAYANDVSSYIVSKRLLDEGGYEVRNSVSTAVTYGRPEQLQPAMEDRIIDQVRAMLPEGYGRR
jgi:hypothetical protein